MAKNKRRLKLLVILASPRKSSNSTDAARHFVSNLKNPGEVTVVNVNSLKIKPCIACKKCAKTFNCFMGDDSAGVIKEIGRADVIVVASPVYFTGAPAQLKLLIDKNQPQWERRNSETGNRKPEKSRAGIIILTTGDNKRRYFMPAEREIRSMFAVNGIKTGVVVRLMNMDEPGSFDNNERYKEILKKQQRKCKDRALPCLNETG